MSDDEWEQHRSRAILAAFQTGRPVFADSDGKLRYADGIREPLEGDTGMVRFPVPTATIRAPRRERWAAIWRWIRQRLLLWVYKNGAPLP